MDREKTIKGLTDIGSWIAGHVGFEMARNFLHTIDDAVAMLKEQEAEIEHLKRPNCEHAEHDGIGCLGYCGCTQDDEPIESCKRCEKYTGNVYEAVKRDDMGRIG